MFIVLLIISMLILLSTSSFRMSVVAAAVAGGVTSHGSPCCNRVGVVPLGNDMAQQFRGVGACERLSLLSSLSV